MQFQADQTDQFKTVFMESKHKIRSMPGCLSLELLQDASDPAVFYTLSIWNTVQDLENYRQSELFTQTWAKTKVLFAGKPTAFSLKSVMKVY